MTIGSPAELPEVAASQPPENVAAENDPPDVVEKWEAWRQKMEQVTGLAELIVAKQRHGSTGRVRLKFEARITKFSDLAPDDMRAAFDND